jgi:hypothetical protein
MSQANKEQSFRPPVADVVVMIIGKDKLMVSCSWSIGVFNITHVLSLNVSLCFKGLRARNRDSR